MRLPSAARHLCIFWRSACRSAAKAAQAAQARVVELPRSLCRHAATCSAAGLSESSKCMRVASPASQQMRQRDAQGRRPTLARFMALSAAAARQLLKPLASARLPISLRQTLTLALYSARLRGPGLSAQRCILGDLLPAGMHERPRMGRIRRYSLQACDSTATPQAHLCPVLRQACSAARLRLRVMCRSAAASLSWVACSTRAALRHCWKQRALAPCLSSLTQSAMRALQASRALACGCPGRMRRAHRCSLQSSKIWQCCR